MQAEVAVLACEPVCCLRLPELLSLGVKESNKLPLGVPIENLSFMYKLIWQMPLPVHTIVSPISLYAPTNSMHLAFVQICS